MKTQLQRDRDEESGADIGEMLMSAGGGLRGAGWCVCIQHYIPDTRSYRKILGRGLRCMEVEGG